jgi:hypothetical protein
MAPFIASIGATAAFNNDIGIFSSIAVDIGKFRDVTKLMLANGMPSCSTARALHFPPVPM